jgi:aspartyl-tRNA(Asn)/glutamyl-tRNA(Gln) amidotransferase subunit C
MAITRADVLHVAKLARLELRDAEVDAMVKDIDRILEYVRELETVDTEHVPPTEHLAVDRAPFRPDEVVAGVAREQALAEAPRERDGGFRVPGFVDEG